MSVCESQNVELLGCLAEEDQLQRSDRKARRRQLDIRTGKVEELKLKARSLAEETRKVSVLHQRLDTSTADDGEAEIVLGAT